MEFFRETKFDFLGVKTWFIGASILVMAAGVFSIMTRGFAYGIDFRGGADVVLKFREAPEVAGLRSALGEAGFSGLTIQSIGEPADNEVLIRLDPGGEEQAPGAEAERPDIASEILRALRTADEQQAAAGKLDLNVAGEAEIRTALEAGLGPGSESAADSAALAIRAARTEQGGLLSSMDQIKALEGISPEAAAWLSANAIMGRFAIRSVDYVGPAVGGELRAKARWAVLWSLVAMLIYIGFRFKGAAYGVSAIVTLAHDVLVTLGFLSFFQKEFDLTVLAAVLTIVGYSVNDTIVIFDRVRENLRLHRQTEIEKVFNNSINQCLSRTILTSLLVFMVLLSIWGFGGSRLEPFSFTLIVGVISGSYSTIYIASPMVIWWLRWTRRQEARA